MEVPITKIFALLIAMPIILGFFPFLDKITLELSSH
jgi:hypothetical protein